MKRISGEVGRARKSGDTETGDRLAAESRSLGEQQAARDAEATALAAAGP